MKDHPRTREIMSCVMDALNEQSRERSFALTDAARAAVEQLEEAAEHSKSGDAQDAARWRWWCKWWFDEKDDMEKLNGLEYEDQATLNAAVDSEIASESHKPNSTEEA